MTPSLDALKAYVEGERKYRRARYTDAVQAYMRAVALDSSFARAPDDVQGWVVPGDKEYH